MRTADKIGVIQSQVYSKKRDIEFLQRDVRKLTKNLEALELSNDIEISSCRVYKNGKEPSPVWKP